MESPWTAWLDIDNDETLGKLDGRTNVDLDNTNYMHVRILKTVDIVQPNPRRTGTSLTCNAAVDPENGNKAECTNNLGAGKECKISCHNGYEVSLHPSCSENGVFIPGECKKMNDESFISRNHMFIIVTMGIAIILLLGVLIVLYYFKRRIKSTLVEKKQQQHEPTPPVQPSDEMYMMLQMLEQENDELKAKENQVNFNLTNGKIQEIKK